MPLRIYLLALLCLGLPQALWAQEYHFSGQVVDAFSREPLMGATVSVDESRKGANTGFDGLFTIKHLLEPSVRLRISYIGYESQVLTLDLRQTPKTTIIPLKPSDMEVDAVEISAQAEGQVAAFLQQKRSITIKNVLSADQIQSFPDLNAAEALQRVPGITLQRDQGEGRYVQLRGTPPELSTFNVNGEQIPSPEGEVRYVGLDIIAADQIEFMEVTKVLTPDLDADGIAGNINIITKEAREGPAQIRAVLSGGYNNLRGTPNYQAQFSYGQRTGIFGFNLNTSYYVNEQGADNLEYKYAKGPFFGLDQQQLGVDNYSVQYRQVELRHYNLTRTRLAVSPTWDLTFNDHHKIYLRGMYNRFVDDEIRRRKIYDTDDAVSETYYRYGGVLHDARQRTKIQEVSTANLGGEHDLGWVEIEYMVQMARATENRPDHVEVAFENPGQAVQLEFDRSDPQYPRVNYPRPEDTVVVFDYENYDFEELLFEDDQIVDDNLAARLNLTFPYRINDQQSGYFKTGGKIRSKDKRRDITVESFGAYFQTSNTYPGEGPPLTLPGVSDGFREDNLLNQGYVMEMMPSPDRIREFYHQYPQFFIYDRTDTREKTDGEDYQAEEDIYAVYGMIRHDWGPLMMITGLRYERTDINYQANFIQLERGRFDSLIVLEDQRTIDFFLPHLQFRYAINQDFNLRAALSYNYARPNFSDVLPFRQEDDREVEYGNPNLKFASAMNLDLLAEYYFLGGMVSGGAFYKDIDDPVFNYKRFAHEGLPVSDFPLKEITKPINGKSARVYGAELQAQFQFTFLPGFLQHFGLFTNYTYTASEAFISERLSANYSDAVVNFLEDDLGQFSNDSVQEAISMPGQAEHTLNLALLYRSKRFYARLAVNYQDDFLYQLGADRDLDEYYEAAFRVDFTTNYTLTPNLKIFVDLINLNNTPLVLYLNTPDRVQQQEFYSWWGRLGLKLNF